MKWGTDTLKNLEQLLNYWKHYFSWEESREDILLDHRLTSLYCEIREWEMKFGPRLSEDFNIRLESILNSMSDERDKKPHSWLESFIQNRKLQYGMAFTTAALLLSVLVGRWMAPSNENIPDTAGVIIDNSSYLNQSSYVEYSDSYYRRVLIDKLKKEENSLKSLHELEKYYLATGRNGLANEIHFIIQELEE